jgi:hypothetical protein
MKPPAGGGRASLRRYVSFQHQAAGVSKRKRIIEVWQTQEIPEKRLPFAFSFAIRQLVKITIPGNYVNTTNIISCFV